jgi:hypothetical protein
MELEMLEPSLFLLQSTGGGERFADAIEACLNTLPERREM